ncbi:hypothetical protein HPB49_016212 [Dermacentor silvarum]|uniref:Uncharacterized protein n=1 Tax=Dermacentor silvarum TaxID=543639 RepID=A0ACB8CAD5_DERSI|nr:hypothetical protein HPB49_016212 [Dermacentor silvarum]
MKQIALPYGSFEFDYYFNQAHVSLAVLKAPVYYFNGTDVMVYGGFGALYAQQAARTMDLVGRLTDVEGRLNGRDWLHVYYSYREKMKCTYKQTTRVDLDMFPLVAGLEIAFRAFRDVSRSNSISDRRLESLERYTEYTAFLHDILQRLVFLQD